MLIIVFILIFSAYSLSQESGAPAVELFFYTVNVPGTPIMNIQLDAQSSVWGWESPSTYFLTHDYDVVVYTPDYNNMPPGEAAGINFVTSPGGANQLVFAYGLYKISSNRTNKYFYLDYRDDRIGFYQPPYYGDVIDLWIKYDYNSNKFFYSSINSTTNFVEIQNSQVLNLWEIKQKGNPSSYLFTGFNWQSCLLLSNKGNGCPWLIWGAYPNSSVTVLNYKLYRSVTNDILPPPEPNYVPRTLPSTVLNYEDTEFSFNGPFTLRYKVKAFVRDASNNEYETEATNVVQTSGGFYKETRKEIKELSTQIVSNYPNPFNPTTMIKYNLSNSGNIKLVITNSLGEAVKVIEEGLKEAGENSAVFNSENLPSGIYICSLITNGGITSNKMLLLR